MRCSLPAMAATCVLGAIVSGCTGGTSGITPTASYNPGYGPFDQHGNYVEAWADKPAKKHWWAKKPATPKPAPTVAKKEPVLLASTTPRPGSTQARTTSQPKPAPRPVAYTPPPRPTPPPAAPKPAPKPTPKPKPKPKPVVWHKVAKGDTLYALSRRYGSSVSAIQRANGISGTNIRIGQSLKIPK